MEAKFANVALSRSQATPDTCKRFHEALGAPIFFFGGGSACGRRNRQSFHEAMGAPNFLGVGLWDICGHWRAENDAEGDL